MEEVQDVIGAGEGSSWLGESSNEHRCCPPPLQSAFPTREDKMKTYKTLIKKKTKKSNAYSKCNPFANFIQASSMTNALTAFFSKRFGE